LAIGGLGAIEFIAANAWAIPTLGNDDLRDISPSSTIVGLLQSSPGSELTQRRVSIQVDDEDEWTGPFRLIYEQPLAAESAADDMMTTGLLLELAGFHLEASIDDGDPNAFDYLEMASGLEDMGFFLNDFCPIDWNYNIVGSGSNDGIVPWGNQSMPNSQTTTLLNISHPQETAQASAILTQLNSMTGR
jgi:hypothetical protein